jgi:ribosome-binding protein aMBF1 (putative translation factor)
MLSLDNISYIEDSHGKKAVIMSLESYQEIQEKLEEFEDINSYLAFKEKGGETFPVELVDALINSQESKIRIIRRYRGYSLSELAAKAEITESYLSQIENGKRTGTIELYKQLSNILNIEIDFLV